MRRIFPSTIEWIIGIDEVGRGPIAGPLVLGAWMCYVSVYKDFAKYKKQGMTDSKKLSEKQRIFWKKEFISLVAKSDKYKYVTVSISAEMIDRRGMSWALRAAVKRILKKLDNNFIKNNVKKDAKKNILEKNSKKRNIKNVHVLLDGGLRAPEEFLFQETIIRGDASEPVIAAASIIAKVARDAYMVRQAKKFPHYGFEKHKGYGTREHYQAIRKHGVLLLHRKSWIDISSSPF
jgi:ribonuclease HII